MVWFIEGHSSEKSHTENVELQSIKLIHAWE